MTLILSCLTPDFVLQVSDRRLTSSDGKLLEDNATKMVMFNGHMTFALTGLARLPGAHGAPERTDIWLADTLAKQEISPLNEAMDKLADAATDALWRFPYGDRAKRLAFCGCGWVRPLGSERLRPIRVLVSNFHDSNGRSLSTASEMFRVSWSDVSRGQPGRWFVDGQEPSRDDKLALERNLRRLGLERIMGDRVLALATHTMRHVAASNSLVGKNLLSVYMPRSAVKPGTAMMSSGRPVGDATKCLYLRDGDVIGEHRAPHVAAFGTQFVDIRFGPANRDGTVRMPA